MKIAQVAGLVLGVWLMAAPAVLNYAGSPASDLHRVAGPVIASLGLIAMWEATVGVRWPNALLGVGLALAPLLVAHVQAATVTGVSAGVLLASVTPIGGGTRHRIGGGWWSLVGRPHPLGGR